MCKGILRLSWEVDKLHNQYNELLELENKEGLNHSMSNAALKIMHREQDKLNKMIGGYVDEAWGKEKVQGIPSCRLF